MHVDSDSIINWVCPSCHTQIPMKESEFPVHCVCGFVAVSPETKREGPPSFVRRVRNFARATSRYVVAGRPQRSEIEINEILETHCKTCEYYDGQICTHKDCGCPVARAGRWRNKLAWATESCPIGKWGPNVLTPVSTMAVVTCFFNPSGYQRPLDNYQRYAEGIRRQCGELFTVEMAYDDDEFCLPDAAIHVRGRRDRHLLWQKERLLNLAIEKIGSQYDAIAWVDADISFENDEWLDATKQTLNTNSIIQPWTEVNFLTRDGGSEFRRRSVGWYYLNDKTKYTDMLIAHPGYAWAARTDWLRRHGLYQYMVTGGGDSLMLHAFTNSFTGLVKSLRAAWLEHYLKWNNAVYGAVAGRLGCIDGNITHFYHGERKHRHYVDRWFVLADNDYDPDRDIEIDETGLLAWTEHARRTKPHMVNWVQHYFSMRKEDD